MENNSDWKTSPASQTGSAPNTGFQWMLTIVVAIGAMAILAVVVIAGLVGWIAHNGANIAALTVALNGLFGLGLQSIAELVGVIFLLIVLPSLAHRSLRSLGFRPLSPRDIAIVAIGVVTMFVVVTGLGSIFENLFHVKSPEAAVKMFTALHGYQRVLFAVFAIVVGPLAEEMFFRVLLFNAMRTWWGFWPGAIVSSILFGGAHMQPGGVALNVSLVVSLGCGGIILAYIYQRTGKAWANMLTHGAFNALSLLAIIFAPQLAK